MDDRRIQRIEERLLRLEEIAHCEDLKKGIFVSYFPSVNNYWQIALVTEVVDFVRRIVHLRVFTENGVFVKRNAEYCDYPARFKWTYQQDAPEYRERSNKPSNR